MKKLIALLTACLFYVCLTAQSPVKSYSQDGMKIHWQFSGDQLFLTVFAPSQGWVGIGLNDKSKTEGTNYIKANIINGSIQIKDNYIDKSLSFIDLSTIVESSYISNVQGMEGNRGTTVMFSLETTSKDDYHHTLRQGKEIYLTLSYSDKDLFSSKPVLEKVIPFTL